MTIKELKELINDLPDEMTVVCVACEFDIENNAWPISDYLIVSAPKAHEGLYLYHE